MEQPADVNLQNTLIMQALHKGGDIPLRTGRLLLGCEMVMMKNRKSLNISELFDLLFTAWPQKFFAGTYAVTTQNTFVWITNQRRRTCIQLMIFSWYFLKRIVCTPSLCASS